MPSTLFSRVLAAVGDAETGDTVAWLAARVAAPDGSLELVTVEDPAVAVHAGWLAPHAAEQIAAEAEAVSAHARTEAASLHDLETRIYAGDTLDVLRSRLERTQATLAVVGTHGHSRAAGIAMGSITTHFLHEAPCSVLVARPPRDRGTWPQTIVVGIDGSVGSAAALEAAQELADRLGASVRPVVATREPFVELDEVRALAPDVHEIDEPVVHALHVLSEDADLVVVGSRGLRGIRALGSVSERIAHEAVCSVLVVRGAKG